MSEQNAKRHNEIRIPLSNFYGCSIEYEGMVYPSVEHAYQAAKSLDTQVRIKIQTCGSAATARKLGRKIQLRPNWDKIKVDVMLDLLLMKFNDINLWVCLIATQDAELIEGNWWGDKFWGVCNGKGKNMLGKLLMLVREYLK